MLTLYIDGTHDRQWLDSQCAQLDRQRADLTDKIATLTKRRAKAEIDAVYSVRIEQFCERIRQGIDDFTLADKHRVVNTLEIEAVIQRGDAIRGPQTPRNRQPHFACLFPVHKHHHRRGKFAVIGWREPQLLPALHSRFQPHC